MSLMHKSVEKEQTKEIVTSTQYLLKSSSVTPTHALLIQAPFQLRIVPLKLEIPASSAKLVASILFGQIFAIIMDIGRKTKH